ncbi:hypothetical protein D5086_013219 [Populus alba]|uniref:Uncharacterized protein n=4 Tax=Populus TaxID=3689 RepID=A0A4U5P3Z2_POPAL|nr:hypothetical protein D5086_0000228470 [Populus alba]
MEFSIQQLSRLVMDLFLSRACTYNRTQIKVLRCMWAFNQVDDEHITQESQKAFKIVIQSLVEELSVVLMQRSSDAQRSTLLDHFIDEKPVHNKTTQRQVQTIPPCSNA